MSDEVLSLTAQIVSALVAHNTVATDALPALIQSVYTTLTKAGTVAPEPEKLQPAVPVKRSVFHDHIVCLEDGKKQKMLKRHLQTAHGLTPEQYREKWNLPHDYPLVAPSYAEKRSTLAKAFGLGRKAPLARPAPVEEVPEPPASPARRGRKKAAN